MPETETIARVSVFDAHAPESNTIISLIGNMASPDNEGDGARNGNGQHNFVVITPTLKQEGEDIRESLAKARRQVDRFRAIGKADSFDKVFWILLLEQIRSATRARNASIYLVNEAGDLLEPKVWFGDWAEKETPRSFVPGQGIAGTVWSTGEIYLSAGNVQDDSHFEPSTNARSMRVRSILSVPILNIPDRHVIGVLNLDSYRTDRFSPRMKWRIENLQPKAYSMLRQLKLDQSMSPEEVISVFIWMIQKAVHPNYIVEPDRTIPKQPPSPTVDAVYANRVFGMIRDELSPGDGKPGPSPVRLERLWSVFRGRENEPISLDDFESAFADSVEPRKSAASAISWLNNILKRWGYDLQIKTAHCTTYQLMPRGPKPTGSHSSAE